MHTSMLFLAALVAATTCPQSSGDAEKTDGGAAPQVVVRPVAVEPDSHDPLRGKPLREWIDRLTEADPARRSEAVEILGQLGGSAAYSFMDPADRVDVSAFRRELVPEIPRLVELFGSDQEEVAETAALLIAAIGADARDAIPALESCLKHGNPEKRFLAAIALSRVYPENKSVLPELLFSLVTEIPREERELIEQALRHHEGDRRPRIEDGRLPEGDLAVDDADLALGGWAMGVPMVLFELTTSIRQIDAAVPELAAGLENNDPLVRFLAVVTVAYAPEGSRLKDALPGLWNAALNDEIPVIRRTAIKIVLHQYVYRLCILLRWFATNEDVQALAETVLDADIPLHRQSAARVLGDLGLAAKSAVPQLLEALKDVDPSTRSVILESLQEIDPNAAAQVKPHDQSP